MQTLKVVCVILVTIMAVTGTANASFSPIEPITKTFNLRGEQTTITINPEIALSGSPGQVNIGLKANIEADDLQRDLQQLLNKRWINDECGKRFSTSNATVRPNGDGRLLISLTARAQLWSCFRTKVPEFRGLKLYMKMRTESPRLSRRLQTLREWSHEQDKTLFTGSASAGGPDGVRAPGRVPVAMGCDGIHSHQNRLYAGDVA